MECAIFFLETISSKVGILENNTSSKSLARLRGLYANLTSAERRVADYIMASPHEVTQASITEVAKHSEVGVGTVGRLCAKLGYSGFPALKIALAADVNGSDTHTMGLLEPSDPLDVLLHKIAHLAVQNLQDTTDLVNASDLAKAATQLRRASLVSIFVASSVDHGMALLLSHRLSQLSIPSRVLVHVQDYALGIRNAGTDEVIIIVSYMGESMPSLEDLLEASKGKRYTLLLTARLQSPLSEVANITLVASARSSGHIVRDSAHHVGLHQLVDILYAVIALTTHHDKTGRIRQSSTRYEPQRSIDHLRVAVPYLPETMDPQQMLSIANGRIYPLVFSTLINRDWTGSDWKLIPNLAASWKRLDDYTLELSLRPDVEWGDGTPFTAQDVIYTFKRIQSRDENLHVARSGFWSIERIEQISDHQIRIVTAEPDPFLEMRLASHHVAYILPSKHHSEVGDGAFAEGQIIGTGPYQLQTWQSRGHMQFVSNENYFGGQPAAKRLTVIAQPDSDARLEGLLSGRFDLVTDVQPHQLDAINKSGEFQTKSEIIGLDYEVLFNMQAEPVSRREIRQALSLAIDRQYLIDELWRGFAVHPRGSQIPGENYYDPDRPRTAYDPDRARYLLQQGGYSGEPILFGAFHPDYYILDRAMVESIAEMWRELGIRVEVEYYPPPGGRSKIIKRGNTTHHVFEISAGSYNDMHQRLVGMWGKNSDFQRIHFWLPESAQRYNALVDDLATTHDPVARQNIYRKLLDELEYEVPSTPILIPELIYAMRGNIHIAPNNYQGLDLSPANFQVLDEGDG